MHVRHDLTLKSTDPTRSFERMSTSDMDALLAQADLLRCAAEVGSRVDTPLRGRNVGLMCESGDSAAANLFRRAALELGAHVTQLPPRLTAWSSVVEIRQTARILGRLYDGVECQGIPAALVSQMNAYAGVPFFDGIADAGHPTAVLAARVGGCASPEENRRFVVQAILLAAIA